MAEDRRLPREAFMTDRSDAIDAFLAGARWKDAERTPMTGDLSSRRYLRLRRGDGETAILMDAPPAKDATTPAFVMMTGWLRDIGLSAPAILAASPEQGLLILEDLGQIGISGLLATSEDWRHQIYSLAVDLLLHIRHQPAPELASPDANALIDATRLADDWYPGIVSNDLGPFRDVLKTVLGRSLAGERTVSLRDFHADNLMWLPDREGVRKLGLLDYQDAFLVHPVYDLVSMLTDARTDIGPAFREDMLALYAARSGDDPDALRQVFAAWSAQRNLRILGIFARAARAQGRTFHIAKLPRVYGYLAESLQHDIFAQVVDRTLAAIPYPTPALMESLA